jgi:uncharacterized protein YjbJ (UPF0337 family)
MRDESATPRVSPSSTRSVATRPLADAEISRRSQIMGLDDKIKNAAQDIVGKAKETIGNATDNDKLVAEGKADQVKADAKKAGENIKDTFK